MTEYNIGAVAKLTGISTHNLRIWEKRYQLIAGNRSDSGRRIYNDDDVRRLSLIKQCIDLGHSISKLAHLSMVELQSNLAQLSIADFDQAEHAQDMYNLAVVSISVAAFSDDDLSKNHIQLVKKSRSIEELLSLKEALDIVIVESDIVTDELLGQLSALKAGKAPKLILFIYRIAHSNHLTRLRILDIRTVHAPIEMQEIEDILFRFVQRMRHTSAPSDSAATIMQREPIERKFTLEQLDSLKNRPYNINCECPRHISEIIKTMDAFEMYSLQCQNENNDDAAMHASIYRKTAYARSVMESVLEQVLTTENIVI